SEHPLGVAIVDSASARGLSLSPTEGFTSVSGKGITGMGNEHGVAVGNAALMSDWGIDVAPVRDWAGERSRRAETVVYVNIDGEIAGAISSADRARPTAH